MKVKHHRAWEDVGGSPPAYVDVDGEHKEVDEDGVFDVGDNQAWVDRYCTRHDLDRDAAIVDDQDDEADEEGGDAETCQVEKSDGETCGRELPCQYHSDGEEE